MFQTRHIARFGLVIGLVTAQTAFGADTGTETKQAGTTAAAQPCTDCGTITSIEKKTEKGEASGVGAVTGAVLGAVVGREVVNGSRGSRNTAAVVGAVGGGYAGHKIEEKARSSDYYLISVKMDTGERTEALKLESAEGWAVGDKVRIEDGKLVRR